MNTQLLRYNVLTEHLTFPPIPPATRDFGRTGRTHCMKPTAPSARAREGETRFEACLLAKGLSTQSARRLMLTVRRLTVNV